LTCGSSIPRHHSIAEDWTLQKKIYPKKFSKKFGAAKIFEKNFPNSCMKIFSRCKKPNGSTRPAGSHQPGSSCNAGDALGGL